MEFFSVVTDAYYNLGKLMAVYYEVCDQAGIEHNMVNYVGGKIAVINDMSPISQKEYEDFK